MYRGWRLAPSLQAFSSLEKPSRQRFAPVEGLNRERRGGELALTWDRKGLAPIVIKPFAAYETIEGTELGVQQDADRYMAGAMTAFSTMRSKVDKDVEWGFGISISLQGAAGNTSLRGESAGEKYGNWNIAKASAGFSFYTPVGPLSIKAEEGRARGNFGILDAFHLGGLNVALFPDGLSMNRVQQAALPGFTQSGDRMRRFTVKLWESIYYEKAAAWNSKGPGPEYIRIVGAQINLEDLIDDDIARSIGAAPMFSLGIHRPLDGIMKDRYVVTFSLGYRL
jgi:hypothetical protein